MMSVVQIFLGSRAVRSLNSRMSATSVAFYSVGKMQLELRLVTDLSLRGQSRCSARMYGSC